MSRSIRIMISLVLVAGAGFGYWHFLLGPKRAEADRLATQKQTTEALIAQSQAQLATYRKSRDAYDSNYLNVVRLGKAVPADDDVRSLMLQLDTSASRSSVDFSGVQIGGSGGGSSSTSSPAGATGEATSPPPGAVQIGSAGFSAMPFSFDFHGTFDGLESFFARVQRMVRLDDGKVEVNGRLLRLESFQLSPDSTHGFPVLDAQILATSYLAPAQTGLKKASELAASAAATTAPGSTTTPPTTTEVAG